MTSVTLISEQFERAAYSLSHSLQAFTVSHDIERLTAAASQFAASVDKLQTILGMQAENDQRKVHGLSMAYTEDAFASV